ncbi:uncharacterized protein VP01_1226g1, partial [Puccinia sorghi]
STRYTSEEDTQLPTETVFLSTACMGYVHMFDSCHNVEKDSTRLLNFHNRNWPKPEPSLPALISTLPPGGTQDSRCFSKYFTFGACLLELSCEATELLCASNYPTLNKALPIYIILIKGLRRVQSYLIDALKKLVYFAAMVLDPAFKTNFWKHNKVLEIFRDTAKEFLESFFYSELYQADVEDGADKIKGEISQYLKEDVEPDGTNILLYWKNRQSKYPILMVLMYSGHKRGFGESFLKGPPHHCLAALFTGSKMCRGALVS